MIIITIPVKVVNFLIFTDSTNCTTKKSLTKKQRIINKNALNNKSTN